MGEYADKQMCETMRKNPKDALLFGLIWFKGDFKLTAIHTDSSW